MNKKFLFVLVLTSCFFSVFAFVRVFSKQTVQTFAGNTLQTAVTNADVSVKIKGGALSITKTPVPTMSELVASADDQVSAGSLGEMEVTDLRGAKGTGWTVNIDSMTDYYNGDNTESIPLTNTQFNVKDLTVTKGDATFVSVSNGNLVPTDNNADKTSDGAITLAQTQGTVGGKKYSGINSAKFTTDMNLTVPGGLPADTYTSVYTISVQ